jgi:hypothetical protein
VQDATEDWYDEPVHGDWISTKEFVSTGEKFYLISKGDGGDDNKGGHGDEDDDADDDLEDTFEHQQWAAMLPPSLQWLATNEGVEISTTRFAANTFLPLPLHYPGRIANLNSHPTTRVSTPAERELFKEQYRNFPDTSNSQNSHDGWDFGAMAIW